MEQTTLDMTRLTIGLIATFGILFLILTTLTYFMCDRKFWKSVGMVSAVYAICGGLVFFIVAMVSWSFDKSIWEMFL